MAWNIYHVAFESKSPIHIGYREIGNVVKTRYYIPGRTVWGAVTAKLARALQSGGSSTPDYTKVGDYVERHLRFSYFFPATKPDLQSKFAFRPEFSRKGEYYGSLSRNEFERRYLNSWASTAISPKNFAHEDGSLHETENLSARASNAEPAAKLYFTGYAYFNDSRKTCSGDNRTQDDNYILQLMNELFIGGERRYGFGRVVRFKSDQAQYLGNLNGADPEPWEIGTSSPFLAAHLIYRDELKDKVRGPLEPFLGRVWKSQNGRTAGGPEGAGHNFSDVNICWVPGSEIINGSISIIVNSMGMWKAV